MRILPALVFLSTLSTLSALLAGAPSAQPAADTHVLDNGTLRATFTNGRLESIVRIPTGDVVRFDGESFAVTVNGAMMDTAAADAKVSVGPNRLTATYTQRGTTVSAEYEMQPGWGFLSKRLRIDHVNQDAGGRTFRVNEVNTLIAGLAPRPIATLPLTEGRFGTILRLPAAGVGQQGASVFLVHQNPYNTLALADGHVRAGYAPDMDWRVDDGAFESDRLLVGLVPRSGRVMPASSVPEWTFVPDYDRYLREHATIDEAESSALVDAVRAFLLVHPKQSTRVHVPWCENDYQIDVATPAGWTEYQRILDTAAALGIHDTLFTGTNSALASLADNRDAWGWENLLFFGLGQKIRTGAWVPGRDPVPPALRTMIDAGAARGLKYMAYAYPTLPFLQDPAWTAWAGGRLGGYRGVDTGQRGFQDWWVDTLVNFVKATGAGGFSFDHWWIAIDDPAATSKYAQWYGARRILETLRRRLPDIVIDGRQQYMNFGPWTWLAGSYPHPTLTDEQPESFAAFPDLHTDRVSADRQRFAAWKYRVERFAPPEIVPGFITHQTERSDEQDVMRRDRFRPRDWDLLGWKYSLLSSIATAPFNHVVNFIPARDKDEFAAFSDGDKAFFRRWLDWTDTNADILRHVHPILGPPMIGRVDGTAAIVDGRGFVFLFNPNYRAIDAHVRLDASIGLTSGGRFVLKELYPEEGRLVGKPGAGFWHAGDEVVVPMGASEARVLELVSSDAAITAPMLFNFNARGRVTRSGGTLTVTGAVGEPGTSRDVVIGLPPGPAVTRLTVNGTTVPFRRPVGPDGPDRNNAIVEATVTFDGVSFERGHGVFPYDPAFAGGTLSGTVTVPARIPAQLHARQAAWPVPYTADDLRATWLGSDRLLLYAQIAEPDDSLSLTLRIDGQPVALAKAYNSIYAHSPKRTFVGWYADVSSLAPDVPHRIELTLPALPAGHFQGLFFENVEPEWTTRIK